MTIYSKLYVGLRRDLADTTVAARDAKPDVWAHDATLPGFTLQSRSQLTLDERGQRRWLVSRAR